VLAVHPPPPRHRDWWKLRNRQLEEIANLVRSHSGTWLVLGDLNTTPWAPSFRRLVRASGLVNSALGHGLDPTWPARWPWPLRIPIDHCLHSPALTTINRRVGPAIGSDHLPLIVDIGLGR
jgi:endonuclease/exonuclease/phosphatase (EEP) superfamily protein YafD